MISNPEPVLAKLGDTITCPGCGEQITLDWADGWRNDNGFTCNPPTMTHSSFIDTLRSDRG